MTGREPASDGGAGAGASPWFREQTPRPTARRRRGPDDQGPPPGPGPVPPYDSGRTQDAYGTPPRAGRHARQPAAPEPVLDGVPTQPTPPAAGAETHVLPVFDGERPGGGGDDTHLLPVFDGSDEVAAAGTAAGPVGPGRAERRRAAAAAAASEAGAAAGVADGADGAVPPPGPGRAARRKAAAAAAKGRGGRRKPPPAAGATAAEAPDRPLTRVEARRAARAAKDSPAVIASRAMGELFITCGVLMLLFVTYQLWWTNVRAGMEVSKEKDRIAQSFKDEERAAGAFKPGEGFAIMYIPKLDVVVPVAETIDKEKVLDRGMVGHYAEGKLKTAMPSDTTGNFAVAGHRNTHGEPFRYINRLKPGDPIVVETRDAYYTYEMASILPQTAPSNISVLDPVPRGSGFDGPGRYLTMTTCTPEFTSTYRMIVWGKMVEERPRSKGKPDALVG
ncbi:class E sortase [Streptomyces sp. NPDC048057]|uniref:class E sortase n=1 Tax=Streptomyces sp. NPDC048057 TaxID=3155628 RepID=UPI0033C22156